MPREPRESEEAPPRTSEILIGIVRENTAVQRDLHGTVKSLCDEAGRRDTILLRLEARLDEYDKRETVREEAEKAARAVQGQFLDGIGKFVMTVIAIPYVQLGIGVLALAFGFAVALRLGVIDYVGFTRGGGSGTQDHSSP